MTAHVSPDQFERYLARTLASAELLRFHDHLDTCPDCRATLFEATLTQQTSGCDPAADGFPFPSSAGRRNGGVRCRPYAATAPGSSRGASRRMR